MIKGISIVQKATKVWGIAVLFTPRGSDLWHRIIVSCKFRTKGLHAGAQVLYANRLEKFPLWFGEWDNTTFAWIYIISQALDVILFVDGYCLDSHKVRICSSTRQSKHSHLKWLDITQKLKLLNLWYTARVFIVGS